MNRGKPVEYIYTVETPVPESIAYRESYRRFYWVGVKVAIRLRAILSRLRKLVS